MFSDFRFILEIFSTLLTILTKLYVIFHDLEKTFNAFSCKCVVNIPRKTKKKIKKN